MAFYILLGAFLIHILLALTEISSTLMKMGEEKKSLLCGDLIMLSVYFPTITDLLHARRDEGHHRSAVRNNNKYAQFLQNHRVTEAGHSSVFLAGYLISPVSIETARIVD